LCTTLYCVFYLCFFFFQAEDGIRDDLVTGVQTCALPICVAGIAEVQHFFGVPEPSTLERDTLVNRSCDWHKVDQRRMETVVEARSEERRVGKEGRTREERGQ